MSLHEIEFTSANGRDTIFGWVYEPATKTRGIIHIVHGLGEHSRRYLRLITKLLDAGFVVVADDHAGHGKTAMTSGVWADAGDDADQVVVADERILRDKVRELYPNLPYVVFGHSWGSMIARGLVSDDSDWLEGLILCGIAAQIHGIDEVLDRDALAAESDPTSTSTQTYAGQMFDGFTARYGPDAFPTAWVARDPGVVRDHAREDEDGEVGADCRIPGVGVDGVVEVDEAADESHGHGCAEIVEGVAGVVADDPGIARHPCRGEGVGAVAR
ncbi:alpha/beta hydrolase, partial [Gordonia sp. 852002-10350_SCH5691597]|uniref:alpha/beta hydrolase n=1 Tax=Gordonia sp. 852002-10350_SCH5691597 TaxID=1834085 RepID=UPI000A683F6D